LGKIPLRTIFYQFYQNYNLENYKDEFLIGRKPVSEALQKAQQIEKVWIEQSVRGEYEKEIRYACRSQGIPLITAPDSKLNNLVKKSNHQGIVAQLSFVKYHKIADVIPFIFEKGHVPKIILLDGVEDVRNIGAIARSAHWFGFQAMVVPMKETARLNAFAMKASMGALPQMLVCREKSMISAIEVMQNSGMQVFGAAMKGKSFAQAELSGPVGIVLGSEEKGISHAVQRQCDDIVSIPGIPENMESLNVSVAAGIMMHEIFKASNPV